MPVARGCLLSQGVSDGVCVYVCIGEDQGHPLLLLLLHAEEEGWESRWWPFRMCVPCACVCVCVCVRVCVGVKGSSLVYIGNVCQNTNIN